MTQARLGNVLIENFRSLNGTVSIPLDAPIVLLHGSNGMGKTSVLSALELALTGQIEHLQRVDSQYASHLLHRGSAKGYIKLTQAGVSKGVSFGGTVQITKAGKTGKNLLPQVEAKFFSERCYLPQSALGRLLELYQNPDTKDKTSPLTKFVKDLLGLDQLDAVVDGLYPALHVTRVRNLVPDYRRLEAMKSDVDRKAATCRARGAELSLTVSANRNELANGLRSLYGDDDPIHGLLSKPAELKKAIEQDTKHEREIVRLTRTRQEVASLGQRWARIPQTVAVRARQDKEHLHQQARHEYEKWLAGPGAQLEAILKSIADLFPSLPPVAGTDPADVLASTQSFIASEHTRCQTLLEKSANAAALVKKLNAALVRSKARLADIDAELGKLAGDSEDLAHALAGIVPHIHDDVCPVCSRDFKETRKRSLSTHVAASIAALTQQAGKLKDYTRERTQEAGRIRTAEQEILTARKGELPAKTISELTVRVARLSEAAQKLEALKSTVAKGSALLKRHVATREDLARASVGDEVSIEIKKDLDKWATSVLGRSADAFNSTDELIKALLKALNDRMSELQRKQAGKSELLSLVSKYIEVRGEAQENSKQRVSAEKESVSFRSAERNIEQVRSEAKHISEAASNARAAIVGRVFNTSLNKMWRDLFVRLAPNEQFVPAFKLPETGKGAIEASLETIHRRDRAGGGPPGTMLSAGNLNTAALTLFLALHLSVARRLPWLILDDPVQSMDDVHISQFAALLRMISKGLDRQIVLAVHDRALFEYLSLELSPAFEDDRLITVELSRTIEGTSVATPQIQIYKPDNAIAA